MIAYLALATLLTNNVDVLLLEKLDKFVLANETFSIISLGLKVLLNSFFHLDDLCLVYFVFIFLSFETYAALL